MGAMGRSRAPRPCSDTSVAQILLGQRRLSHYTAGSASANDGTAQLSGFPGAHSRTYGDTLLSSSSDLLAYSPFEASSLTDLGFLSYGVGALDALHSSTGLPWWAAIPASTLLVRSLMLPLSLRQVGRSLSGWP